MPNKLCEACQEIVKNEVPHSPACARCIESFRQETAEWRAKAERLDAVRRELNEQQAILLASRGYAPFDALTVEMIKSRLDKLQCIVKGEPNV